MKELESSFRSPGPGARPLQIVHGMDVFVGRDGAPGLEGIDRTLRLLKDRGIGGIVTNVSFRGYMKDPAQWNILRHGITVARALGLVVWIYDEEGYPSGAAGGLVLEGHPALEARGLACVTIPTVGPAAVAVDPPDCFLRLVGASAFGGSSTIDLSANVDGAGRLRADLPAGSWTVQYFFEKPAYEGTHAQGNVHASRRYINVLEPDAVRRFIEVTHDAYERELGKDLGGAQAFFTDEPSLMTSYIWPLPPNIEGKVRIQDPLASKDRSPMVAWSRRFPEEFRRRKGYDLVPCLPDLFADRSPRSRVVREDYREVVGELFAETYFGLIGDWCEARGLQSSGHVLVEENVLWHAVFLGDLFTLIRRMSYPGIDMLDSDPRSILATDGFMVPKQVSSAAHLAGRPFVMSETSDWFQRNEGRAATPAEMRGTTNLQYLLGVTTITSYHDWAGRGAEYAAFLDHAARLHVLLTAGRHDARVGVLYPIRAAAGLYVPHASPPLPATQQPTLRAVVAGWTDTCRVLLTNQVDFDCIDERALNEGSLGKGALKAGAESYQVIVIPPTDRLSDASLAKLARMLDAGGRVVMVQDPAVPVPGGLPASRERLTSVSLTDLGRLAGNVVPRVLQVRPGSPDVLCARYVLRAAVLYFVVNAGASPVTLEAAVDEAGACRIWNPTDGTVLSSRSHGNGEWIPLALEGDGSLFITVETRQQA